MRKPFSVWLLIFFLVFLGLGGLYGGITMLADPSGHLIQMQDVLADLLVPNYVLPGLFLTTVMGLLPLLLAYALALHPSWPWAQKFFRWSGQQHWAWTSSALLGIVLAFWLAVQGALIGYRWPIQFVTIANDLIILGLCFLPQIRRYYSIPVPRS